MEENLKELADRARKAVENKNHLSEKESMKLTIIHSMDNNVVRYKERKLKKVIAESTKKSLRNPRILDSKSNKEIFEKPQNLGLQVLQLASLGTTLLNHGRKFTWKIENFSSIEDEELFSEDFIVYGNEWRLCIYPKESTVELCVANPGTLPFGWCEYAQIGLAVINQIDRRNSLTQVVDPHLFAAKVHGWGMLPSFVPFDELHDPKRGYLTNDACLVEAYFSTDRTKALISHELIVETDSDKLKTMEATCDKATIDYQKTTVTKPEELTTPAPTLPSCRTVAIGPEEDIKTFFSSLESELSSSKTVFSRAEAKEALAKLEEALNMTPVNFYYSGKFSSLKEAIKMLDRLDCSSTTLTIEQKNVLLAMEESLKELAGRAAKAEQDKKHLIEKESIKLILTRNLDDNVIRYKEVESEVKQIEQTLAALHEQVEEAQKKRENMLAKREGIFRSSKEMKVELDALGKEWAEYEAKGKVAEEEAETVEAEWGRMKRFVSSVKRKI
ncbi:hypothetical protein V6N11_054219 [Hibiscus sabdariffa]|uniref:MATH domain-containing protein n=1 Tax=Hibiscus sabdariffa TaxID=183260 RepID=A0ABR2S3F0_9ROSI